jgi:hypothetical protein
MNQLFSQNKSKLGDSIAQPAPFSGEFHYSARPKSPAQDRRHAPAEDAPDSNAGFLLLTLAAIIILVGGCFAIAASSSTTDPTNPAKNLFYVD